MMREELIATPVLPSVCVSSVKVHDALDGVVIGVQAMSRMEIKSIIVSSLMNGSSSPSIIKECGMCLWMQTCGQVNHDSLSIID